MQANRKVIDRAAYESATAASRAIVVATERRLEKYRCDPEQRQRRENQACVVCHYGPHLAGQSFTQRQCGQCETTVTHQNTRCPVLCMVCAKKHGLCRFCGGDLNLVIRKKALQERVSE